MRCELCCLLLLLMLQLLHYAESDSDALDLEVFSTSDCKTLEPDSDPRAKTGLPCVFPFIYQGKEYNGCTTVTDPENLPWCATAVNETGYYISKSQQYGHCSPNCPNHQSNILDVRGAGPFGDVPDVQSRCTGAFKCVKQTQCLAYQAERNEVRNLAKNSPTFQQKLFKLKNSVCNYPSTGVCCANEEPRPQEVASELGSACKNCVELSKCPALLELWKVKTRENTEKIKSLVCNKEKKLLCCDQKVAVPIGAEDLTNPGYLPRADKRECGDNVDTSRIIGGENTKPGTYPSAVLLARVDVVDEQDKWSLVIKKVEKRKYICGGTLINRWYVLTAAHCKDKDPRKRIRKVALGDWDTNTDPDCAEQGDRDSCLPPVQIIDVEEGGMIVHPGYTVLDRNVQNDIALVRLSRMAEFNDAVRLACLPLDPVAVAQKLDVANLREAMEGKWPEVVGWGFTEGDPDKQFESSNFAKGGSSASEKQQVLAIPVLKSSACKEKAGFVLEDYQICAGGQQGRDSCKGDSGGPLYMSKFSEVSNRIVPGNTWYLFGLVSYGSAACGTGKPGVYTRVEPFIPWILETINRG